MEAPFDQHTKEIADGMGIALYQRFTINEASLFLRCPESDVQQLLVKNKINHIQVTKNKVAFFGYQLVEYLLNQTTYNANQQNRDPSNTDHIIRAKDVQAITGLSRTTIWRMENKGEFPRRVSLGIGSVGWRHSEVQQWLSSRQFV